MGFLKKTVFGFAALFFILLGGAGTQSDSTLLQGGGFIGLIIGLVVLYIFAKMAWRAMGCLPSLIIIIAVIFFILYAIGAFSGGVGNIENNLRTFLGQGVKTSSQIVANADVSQPVAEVEMGTVNLVGEDQHPILTEKITDNLLSKKETKKAQAFNPLQYPAISSVSRVVSGDTLTLGNQIVKLYGVAAPDISQTCADSSGRGYRCGQQSVSWLSGWLADNTIKCHILAKDDRGVLIGVCMLGPYDIGAALINSGWAVADIRQTQIYLPYQNQALSNRRGLWQGEFYMPWDWQKIQNRKANVKVIKSKEASTSRRKVWFNPFGE
ncbi:MAG: thermonuclease family protein [Alphaproteobacteria bacterium]|nr:thermonuclease family protein [Alphaproteobacteria bacterium]